MDYVLAAYYIVFSAIGTVYVVHKATEAAWWVVTYLKARRAFYEKSGKGEA